MKKKVFFLLIFLILGACQNKKPILIGFIGNLSGRSSDVGVDARNGAVLAVHQINEQGGIHGRPLKLLIKDDESDAAIAKQKDLELIGAKVKVIVGHIVSGMSLAVLPLINQHKMLLVSPTSVSNVFNKIDDYFIRLSPSTQNALFDFAAYARQKGIQKVSFIYDLKNKGYSEDWVKNFKFKFEELGGKTLLIQDFESSNTLPFYDIAKKVLKTQPDAVVLVAGAVDTAMFSQQIKKISPKTQIVIAGWAMTEDLIHHGGRAVENSWIAYNYDKNGQEPLYLKFQEDFKKTFGVSPDFTAKYSYETIMVLAEAMKGLEKITPANLKEKILQKKVFQGLQNKIEFDPYGDIVPKTVFLP